jgi:hypothetical protein
MCESRHDASFAIAGEDYLYNFYYHTQAAIISDAGIVRDICIESDDVITFNALHPVLSDVTEPGSQGFKQLVALSGAFITRAEQHPWNSRCRKIVLIGDHQ